jgi:hydroxypyruvate isomerase
MVMIRQSFSYWCVEKRGIEPEALLAGAAKIGYAAVDLIDASLWPLVRKAGLALAAVNGHGSIDEGMNREENATRIEKEIRANLAKAKEWKFSTLICFSGCRRGLSDEAGLEQCAKTLKRLAPMAEDAGVVLAMELLNSKVDHADYQCDHSAWGIELCKRVSSPAVRLLYDVYHMQIMEGDLIRTIRGGHEFFAHYHTAGNPGRGQPDDTQEIYYPAVYRAIAETGYTGYIAHEFVPAGDPLAAFEKAYRDCAAVLGGG